MSTATAPRASNAGISSSSSCKHDPPMQDHKRVSQPNASSKDSVSSSKSSAVDEGAEELSKDIIWEQMFEELKAIKAKTGTCNLPDKKGRLAKWVYAQRKAFRRLQFSRGTATTRARLDKLESIGFEFSSSSYVAWDIMFEKFKNRDNVDISNDDARKLKLWMSNQRLEYSRQRRGLPNNITQERIAKLEAAGFQWVGRTGKPKSSATEAEDNNSVNCKEKTNKEEDEVAMPSQKAPKKRKRSEKKVGVPSKRIAKNSMRASTTEAGRLNAPTNANNEVCLPMNDTAGSLLKVLAALKHTGATQPSTYCATEPLERTSAVVIDGIIRRAALRNDVNEGDEDVEDRSYSSSESSCSWCDTKATSGTCCNTETKKQQHLSKPRRGGDHPMRGKVSTPKLAASLDKNASHASHSSDAYHISNDSKFKHAMKTAERARNAAAASVVTDSSGNDKRNKLGLDWPTTASLNPASFDNTYLNSLYGSSAAASADSAARDYINNTDAFMQSATLSAIANGGGRFVPDYLTSAAMQEQLRQQHSSSSFESNELLALLGVGGHGNLGLPQSFQNSLLSSYPFLGALSQAPSDNPNIGDLYHPSMAQFIYQR